MKKLFSVGPQLLGSGPALFAWQPSGPLLATTGPSGRAVFLFDRHGTQVREISLPSSTAPVLALDWDCEGEVLAIVQKGDTVVHLWWSDTAAGGRLETLETHSKEVSFIRWASRSPVLAVGTVKGALVLYNKRTRRKEVIVGKHSKRITTGCWSQSSDLLALAGEDRYVTISTAEGQNVEQVSVKGEPASLQFGGNGGGGGGAGEGRVSLVLSGQSLFLLSLSDVERPLELAFQTKYGAIKGYEWFGESMLLVGFSHGYVVVLSTKAANEMSEELHSTRAHTGANSLDKLCCNHSLQKAATAGEGVVKMWSMKDWREIKHERLELAAMQGGGKGQQTQPSVAVTGLQWSKDGQFLTIATNTGYVHSLLTKLTALSAVSGTQVAFLTSLTEITVVDGLEDGSRDKAVAKALLQTEVEPGFLALGPSHCAAGMNNTVWYYRCHSPTPSNAAANGGVLVGRQTYVGSVDRVALTDTHAVVSTEGKVVVHRIDAAGGDGSGMEVLPRKDTDKPISEPTVAGPFLIFIQGGTAIQFYDITGGEVVNEYRHSQRVSKIFPSPTGTRVVLIDVQGSAALYNPIDDNCLPIPEYPRTAHTVLWDVAMPSLFAACDAQLVVPFLYSHNTIDGPKITQVCSIDLGRSDDDPSQHPSQHPCTTALPPGNAPILLYDGILLAQQPNGQLAAMRLKSHDALPLPAPLQGCHDALLMPEGSPAGGGGGDDAQRVFSEFRQNLALGRAQAALMCLMELEKASSADNMPPVEALLSRLARRCLELMELEVALQAYRKLRRPDMVTWVQKLMAVEEKLLLRAHIAVHLERFREAQELFMASSCPECALDLHWDLQQWDQALKLAKSMAPHRLPEVYLRCAAQMEQKGEFEQALSHYEQAHIHGLSPDDIHKHPQLEHHNLQASAGLARSCLRVGDTSRGMAIASEISRTAHDPSRPAGVRQAAMGVVRECAALLEGVNQRGEAAELCKLAGLFEKAAALYIQDLDFDSAGPLMHKIGTPKLHAQYAKAKESRGAFMEAATSYEAAQDWEAVVRIFLQQLNDPAKAFDIVRKSHSIGGAELVAEYCKSKGNVSGAIEFLLFAGKMEEAFAVAESRDEMDAFAKALGEGGTSDIHLRIAKHYETRHLLGKAAQHYMTAGHFKQALNLYLRAGESELDNAIAVVGRARDDLLTRILTSYLVGETDNVPKDPSYLYKLQLALGNHEGAARTAVFIARNEQDLGKYQVAHSLLFKTCKDLEAAGLRIPQSLWSDLTLLHSYILVKRLVKLGDHYGAALMLLRVARSIHRFQQHVVPILTSAVVECQRAGLKVSAHQYACILMKPEYRAHVSDQYKKKIESIVRKPVKEEREPDNAPCPTCGAPLPEAQLECPHCLNISPFCIASGKHLVAGDATQCPHCLFPARYSALVEAAGNEGQCPMCSQPLHPHQLERIDIKDILRRHKALVDVQKEKDDTAHTHTHSHTTTNGTQQVVPGGVGGDVRSNGHEGSGSVGQVKVGESQESLATVAVPGGV